MNVTERTYGINKSKQYVKKTTVNKTQKMVNHCDIVYYYSK